MLKHRQQWISFDAKASKGNPAKCDYNKGRVIRLLTNLPTQSQFGETWKDYGCTSARTIVIESRQLHVMARMLVVYEIQVSNDGLIKWKVANARTVTCVFLVGYNAWRDDPLSTTHNDLNDGQWAAVTPDDR
jgi:hypothetical protein